MRLLGLVGWSGSGKTTLLTALIPHLRALGLSVSSIKHAHHGMDLDRPGKDSFRHREAGAHEVLVVGGQRWALLHEMEAPPPGLPAPETPDLFALARRLEPVDLVLVEGFKGYAFPKLEVHRPALGQPPLWPGMAGVVAVATDEPALGDCPYPLLPLNDPLAIARWVAGFVPAMPRCA